MQPSFCTTAGLAANTAAGIVHDVRTLFGLIVLQVVGVVAITLNRYVYLTT